MGRYLFHALLVVISFFICVPVNCGFRVAPATTRVDSSRFIKNAIPQELNKAEMPKVTGYLPRDFEQTRLHATRQEILRHRKAARKIPLPFMEETVGLNGRWQQVDGNFILQPPAGNQPKGIVHFLGGPFVGAAPHLSYRHLLETMASRGLIIVATPYNLDLDYLRTCDGIVEKFDKAKKSLVEEHGQLPIIGMGHGGGALLHALLSSLFPDMHKDLNVLMSFTNRPASQAIPAFNEVVVPFSKQIMSSDFPSRNLRRVVSSVRRVVDVAVNLLSESSLSPSIVSEDLVPLLRQGFQLVDQVPSLLKEIAEGKQEFSPSPDNIEEVLRVMYRAKRTLLVHFDNDNMDSTAELEKLLKESNSIMRMKLNRPLDNMEIERKHFSGSHVTPLTQNLFADIQPSGRLSVPESYNRLRNQFQSNFLKSVTEVGNELSSFILSACSKIPVTSPSVAKKEIDRPLSDPIKAIRSEIFQPNEKNDRVDNKSNQSPRLAIDFHSDVAKQRAAYFLAQRLKMEEEIRKARHPIKRLKKFAKTTVVELQRMSRDVAMKSAISFATALQAARTGIISNFLAFRAGISSLGRSLSSSLIALYTNGVRLTVGSFTVLLFMLRSMKGLLLFLVKATAKKLAALSTTVGDNLRGAIQTRQLSSNGFIASMSLVVDSVVRGLLLMTYNLFNIGIRLPILGLMHIIHAMVSSIIGSTNSGLHAMSFIGGSPVQTVQHRSHNAVLNVAPSVLELPMAALRRLFNGLQSLVDDLIRAAREFAESPTRFVDENVLKPTVTAIQSERAAQLSAVLAQQFLIALYVYFVPFAYN